VAVAPETLTRLSRLVTAHILTQCLYCVAELGVVDAMPVDARPFALEARPV
jgi:hypothetical protein